MGWEGPGKTQIAPQEQRGESLWQRLSLPGVRLREPEWGCFLSSVLFCSFTHTLHWLSFSSVTHTHTFWCTQYLATPLPPRPLKCTREMRSIFLRRFLPAGITERCWYTNSVNSLLQKRTQFTDLMCPQSKGTSQVCLVCLVIEQIYRL